MPKTQNSIIIIINAIIIIIIIITIIIIIIITTTNATRDVLIHVTHCQKINQLTQLQWKIEQSIDRLTSDRTMDGEHHNNGR